MTQLRIFSYLPNPRIWKATIAARLCGVEIELRGSSPKELQGWLWDFDARPLSEADREAATASERVGRIGFKGGRLFKTDAFLGRNPSARCRRRSAPTAAPASSSPTASCAPLPGSGMTGFPSTAAIP